MDKFAGRIPGSSVSTRKRARYQIVRTSRTMCGALSPASSYCFGWLLWSIGRSGSVIGRNFSPPSSMPRHARCCITSEQNPPAAPSSTITSAACSRASRSTSATSSGLAKRASATVHERRCCHHLHQFQFVGGHHQHHIGKAAEIDDVEGACIGRSARTNQSRAIPRKADGNALQHNMQNRPLAIGGMKIAQHRQRMIRIVPIDRPDGRRDRHAIVVQHDDRVDFVGTRVVHRLVSHAGAHRSVADNRDNLPVLVFQLASDGHAKSSRDRRRGVTSAKRVVLTFGMAREARKADMGIPPCAMAIQGSAADVENARQLAATQ